MQTFDPSRRYGANLRRFLNYINLCLGNRFRTMQSARMKARCAARRTFRCPGKLMPKIGGQGDDDEYCHAHSDCLRKASEHLEKHGQDRHRITEFTDFVSREDSGLGPALEAILATGTQADAARFLRTTDAGFTPLRNRLRQLGGCFENGEAVPKQRGPYKKRVKTRIAANIVAA